MEREIESPKQPQRRRSSSLDSKVIKNYRENISPNEIQQKGMNKYASSVNLYSLDNTESEKSVISQKSRYKPNLDSNCYFLFVNWHKDFKSVRSLLMGLHDPNIFKEEFPRPNEINHEEYFPSLVFFVCNNLKIDSEYEVYVINDYDCRIKEILEWSDKDSNKELKEEYSRGLELMDKQITKEATPNDREKDIDNEKSNQRRHSESMALILQTKNQLMQTFLPREYQDNVAIVRETCECEIFYLGQEKKYEKNSKILPRCAFLTNFDIYMFTRNNLKLKDYYILRHLYLGQCFDTQMANIDSCLRIGGPFGNDMIIRFQNPQTRNKWNNYIYEQILAYQESIKNSSATIIIFNDTNPPSSVPLVSKTITINGSTTGLALKKLAMTIFEIKDVDIKDLSIIFQMKNKENVLHDDVLMMILQEHANNIQENNCTKSCLDCDKLTAIVKIIYYLRSNKTLTDNLNKDNKDGGKSKRTIITKTKEENKYKQNKYNIDSRWIDNEMPKWLMILLSDLYNEGAQHKGIFRVSGSVMQSDEYTNQICETDDVNIDATIHTKASILKKFIGTIDGSLLSSITKEHFSTLSNEITCVDDFLMNDEQQVKLLGFIQNIPANNHNLFQHILVVLKQIIKNCQVNQMNHTSLATCFSQNLFKHLSDDAVKINKLFECILHLIDRIVNISTCNNIIKAYEKRKISQCSGEDILKSDGIRDFESNSPTTSRTVSDSADERKLSLNDVHPSVPPRRKKGNLYKHIKQDQADLSDQSGDSLIKYSKVSPKPYLKDKRQSSSVEIPTDENNIQLDQVDSKSSMPNLFGNSNIDVKPNLNSASRTTRISRDRNTINIVEVLPVNDRGNFIRQNQVNRKHRDLNRNPESPNNSKTKVNQLKTTVKLTRSTDRVIPKTRSRSQTKTIENVPPSPHRVSRHSSKTLSQNKIESSSIESNISQQDLIERKRSSSACRVPQLKEQYESNLAVSQKPNVPVKKHSVLSDSQKVSKIVRNIEENKLNQTKDFNRPNRNKCAFGPIRPSYSIQNSNAPPKRSSYNNNISSLHDKLNDSNDEDVTYI